MATNTFPDATVVKSASMLSEGVHAHYRCPENFLDFALSGPLSSDRKFFQFRPNVRCYGRYCLGQPQNPVASSMGGSSVSAVEDHGRLRLPFDPTEIVDNLRLERYPKAEGLGTGRSSYLRKLYYLVRPALNLAVRKQIQRFCARNWQDISFPSWPVDTTVENICENLLLASLQAKRIESVPFVWFWPAGARGCVIMTHDVETKAGRDHCAELMDMDDSVGIKASFQIVPAHRYPVGLSFVETIRNRGFEIGIQDFNHDGRLFDDREKFLRRAALINRYAHEYGAKGFRAAVLYRNPEWYDALNLSFDMSFPNVAHLDPQRGGCCTVMPYFIGDILEIPVTTTQDFTVFHLLNQRSIDLWKTQIQMVLEKNGLVSFIVHPDYVMEPKTKPVYRKLLAHLRELRESQHLWFALPAEVDTWWRSRSKMCVVKCGNAWRIEGEGAERAVLAYAKNLNGELRYEVAAG